MFVEETMMTKVILLQTIEDYAQYVEIQDTADEEQFQWRYSLPTDNNESNLD